MKKVTKLFAVLLSLSLITAFSACNHDIAKPIDPSNPVNPTDPDDPDDPIGPDAPTDPAQPGNNSDTITILFGKTRNSSASYTQTIKKGEDTVLKANTITYDGYRFAGWMNPITGGLISSVDRTVYSVSYLDKSIVTFTSGYGTKGNEYPLVAAWVADDIECYTITLDSNDGSGNKFTQYYPKNTGSNTFYIAYNPFRRAGYTFAGWTTEKDSTKHFGEIEDHGKCSFDGDITLYAVWQDNSKLYVQYNANDGTDHPEFYEKEFDRTGDNTEISLVLDENTFTREGYVFTTWNCNKVSYYAGVEYKINESVIINAQWGKESSARKIVYHSNYFAEGADEEVTYSYYLVPTFGSSVSGKLRANTFVREGYIFKGWTKYNTDTTISYYDQQDFSTSNTTTDFYALWEPEENCTITITFNANDGTDEPETKTVSVTAYEGYTLPENTFTREGWTFQGWYAEVGPVDYSGCWKVGQNINGSILNNFNKSVAINWFTKDTTWYAIWSKKGCELTLHYNYGDDETKVITYEANKSFSVEHPEREGYKFEGWASTPDAEKYEWYTSFISDKEKETAYAVWSKYYTVTFDANGGEGEIITKKYAKTDYLSIPTNTYTKEGYKFLEWNTKADGTGDEISGYLYTSDMKDYGLEEDFTLYAIWGKLYTVTYEPNGAEGEPVKRPFCLEDSAIYLENKYSTFKKEGYSSCKEWNTKADGTGKGTTYSSINQKDYEEFGITGDFTLYAIWD